MDVETATRWVQLAERNPLGFIVFVLLAIIAALGAAVWYQTKRVRVLTRALVEAYARNGIELDEATRSQLGLARQLG